MASPRITNFETAWVDQDRPAKVFFNQKRIRLRASGSSLEKFGFIWFARPFNFGETIVDMKLHLFQADGGWGTRTITVRPLAANFQGGISRVNYNNKPGVTGTVVAGEGQITQSGTAVNTEWIFNLTAYAQTISTAGSGWWGFRIGIDQDTPREFFTNKAITTFLPYVEYSVSAAPEQPTVLVPDGVVSLQKPTFRADFTDHSGDMTMRAMQVQFDTSSSGFGTPDFDTGTMLTAVPEYNSTLATPGGTWGGLSAAASTFWRTRMQDGTSLWSSWSDPVQITRQNKSTVTITNPASGGSPFVNEFTPAIAWTFGGTQTGFRVLIDRVSSSTLPDIRVGDSGFVSGTATSWQVPPNVLTEDGQLYRVEVRIHDQYERDATPGDPPYAVATRTFTVAAGATVPVSSLTATQVPNTPFLELTWTRATMPDSYTIKRDGEVVGVDLDPTDLFVSGTSYKYTVRNARPNIQHTWKVQANSSGVNSSDVSVLKTTVGVNAIWLWDGDQDIEVEISGTDPGSWEMPETGETLYPLNSRKGVRVTSSLHGWSGQITGTLETSADRTIFGDEWEDRLMQIKERPGRPIHMVIGDRAFRAILWDIVTWPQPSVEPRDKFVSFSFMQVDGFTFKSRSA